MVNKSDCKLGFGYNANLLISDIFKKAPEYLAIAYNSPEITEGVKRVIEEYIGVPAEKPAKKVSEAPREVQTKIKGTVSTPIILDGPMTDKEVDELIHEQEVKAQEPEQTEVITDKPKEKKKMAKPKQPPTDTTETTVELKPTCLLAKINAIRQAWSKTETEKEGKGKAGGGSKYDYYKPQQIIDFCLKQEIEHDLFSEFKVSEGVCSYVLTDIPSGQVRSVECPFDIPRKMAASEAQQVGAAMTYHNRRLAMMMYKIEDNSKENVNVLEDADFSAQNMPAPVIPAPPIITPPPANVAPPAPEQIVQPEVVSAPVNEIKVEEPKVVAPTPEISTPNAPVSGIEEQTGTPEVVAPPTGTVPPPPKMVNGHTPYIDPKDLMDGKVKNGVTVEDNNPSIPPASKTKVVAPPPPTVEAPVETSAESPAPTASKNNIEALYE